MAESPDPSEPLMADEPADEEAGTGGVSAVERRPRISRPTPSHLFAQQKADEDPEAAAGRPRTTRVIPALAGHGAEAEPPADVLSPPVEPAAPAEAAAPDHPEAEYPPDLVFIVRADGTVLYVNRPLGKRGEEDVIGSDFYDWVYPEQHGLVREALARVFDSGRADGLELPGIQQHEPEAWYECRIAPNLRDGKVVSATIIARDVSRYKRAEQELRAGYTELKRLLEERNADLDQAKSQLARPSGERVSLKDEAVRFRALLDAAGEAVFVTDAQTDTLVDLNETACRWLRKPRAELVGQSVHGLGLGFPIMPPLALDVQFTETRDTRRPLVLEGTHRRKDGSVFTVEATVASHTVGGRDYVLAVVRDMKDRRRAEDALAESEARYRALLGQAFDAIFLTTRSGEVVDANAAAVELFGFDQEQLIGLDARALMPRVEDIRAFQRQMGESGLVSRLHVQLRRQDGSTFPAMLSATRQRDAAGQLMGYQWLVRGLGAPTRPAPTAPERPPTRESILLVDGDPRVLRETAAALGRAGQAVLTAETTGAAVQLVRAHGRDVLLAVVGPVGDLQPEDIGRDLRAVRPALPLILATGDDPFTVLERAQDLAVSACLRHPVHPLALVQSVRDALTAAGGH